MQQKFDWNTSTEETEEVLNGTYDSNEDAELTEIMKLELTNCVQAELAMNFNCVLFLILI